MKRPCLPKNEMFWLRIAASPSLVNEFMARGNEHQRKELSKTLEFIKWQGIQEQKGALCA